MTNENFPEYDDFVTNSKLYYCYLQKVYEQKIENSGIGYIYNAENDTLQILMPEYIGCNSLNLYFIKNNLIEVKPYTTNILDNGNTIYSIIDVAGLDGFIFTEEMKVSEDIFVIDEYIRYLGVVPGSGSGQPTNILSNTLNVTGLGYNKRIELSNYNLIDIYTIDKLVIYNDNIYQCIAETYGTWDPTKWQLIGGGGAYQGDNLSIEINNNIISAITQTPVTSANKIATIDDLNSVINITSSNNSLIVSDVDASTKDIILQYLAYGSALQILADGSLDLKTVGAGLTKSINGILNVRVSGEPGNLINFLSDGLFVDAINNIVSSDFNIVDDGPNKIIISLKTQTESISNTAGVLDTKIDNISILKDDTTKQLMVNTESPITTLNKIATMNEINAISSGMILRGGYFFGFTGLTPGFTIPNPTNIEQNYIDFTTNKIYKAKNDLTGWEEDTSIVYTPAEHDLIIISIKFWDIIDDNNYGGQAIYTLNGWVYVPDLASNVDNLSIKKTSNVLSVITETPVSVNNKIATISDTNIKTYKTTQYLCDNIADAPLVDIIANDTLICKNALGEWVLYGYTGVEWVWLENLNNKIGPNTLLYAEKGAYIGTFGYFEWRNGEYLNFIGINNNLNEYFITLSSLTQSGINLNTEVKYFSDWNNQPQNPELDDLWLSYNVGNQAEIRRWDGGSWILNVMSYPNTIYLIKTIYKSNSWVDGNPGYLISTNNQDVIDFDIIDLTTHVAIKSERTVQFISPDLTILPQNPTDGDKLISKSSSVNVWGLYNYVGGVWIEEEDFNLGENTILYANKAVYTNRPGEGDEWLDGQWLVNLNIDEGLSKFINISLPQSEQFKLYDNINYYSSVDESPSNAVNGDRWLTYDVNDLIAIVKVFDEGSGDWIDDTTINTNNTLFLAKNIYSDGDWVTANPGYLIVTDILNKIVPGLINLNIGVNIDNTSIIINDEGNLTVNTISQVDDDNKILTEIELQGFVDDFDSIVLECIDIIDPSTP